MLLALAELTLSKFRVIVALSRDQVDYLFETLRVCLVHLLRIHASEI